MLGIIEKSQSRKFEKKSIQEYENNEYFFKAIAKGLKNLLISKF